MNHDDLPSDSDSDDLDYRPVNDSGSDSIDEKDELLDKEEETTKNKKRRKKARSTRNAKEENDTEEQREESNKTAADPEEEKKRVDALWADFLSGTEIPLKDSKESDNLKEAAAKKLSTKTDIPKVPQKTEAIKKVFEFAGETIEVESNNERKSTENNLNAVSASTAPVNSSGIKRPSTGGLSSVLNQFTKKNKLSVLEKTKLDWDGFKTNEGISEELKTHNKGRDGFLERRDFLERTDFKQFEIEKKLRMASRRSNK